MTHLHGLVGLSALRDLLNVASETSFLQRVQAPETAVCCISGVEIFNLPSPVICPGVWTKEGKGMGRESPLKWTHSQVELPFFFRID